MPAAASSLPIRTLAEGLMVLASTTTDPRGAPLMTP
jgi:hypothetical protein